MTLTRESIQERLRLAERNEESIPLGGTVRLTELTRAQLRDASAWSASADIADRERTRGQLLAAAVQDALAGGDPGEALRQALTAYYIGTPERATDADRWHAALLATGLIDSETHKPLFTREEILFWPGRGVLWDEAVRLAQAILDLSEVGSESLKFRDPAPAAE